MEAYEALTNGSVRIEPPDQEVLTLSLNMLAELGRVLMDAQRVFWRGRLEMTPERVRWWHGAIFARHFPHDGGYFRQECAYFGVVTADGGMRQIEGSSPETLRQDLAEVCASFNGGIERVAKWNASVLEQTRVASKLWRNELMPFQASEANRRVARRAGRRPERIQRRIVSGFLPLDQRPELRSACGRWYASLRMPAVDPRC